MEFDSELMEVLSDKLNRPATREALLDFITWLDLEWGKETRSHLREIFARSLIAMGYLLIEREGAIETVERTLKSAEDYVRNPTELNWNALWTNGTNSYPYGPGEGCFSVVELKSEKECGAGSGCTSCSGSLDSCGLDSAEVMKVVSNELLAWMNGNDPLVSRREQA